MVSSVSSLSSVSFIDNVPADKHALHDIRLRFEVDNIWTIIATTHSELKPNNALLHDQLGFNSFMQMIMIMPFD
jgi:hypothetical protein